MQILSPAFVIHRRWRGDSYMGALPTFAGVRGGKPFGVRGGKIFAGVRGEKIFAARVAAGLGTCGEKTSAAGVCGGKIVWNGDP